MGILSDKKKKNKGAHSEQQFFDEYYREELRNHGRWYFEKIIKENSTLFKQDLDATIVEFKNSLNEHVLKHLNDTVASAKADLKGHIVQQFSQQFTDYGAAMKEAQEAALKSLSESTQALQAQQQQNVANLQKNVNEQVVASAQVLKENMQRLEAMKEAQEAALKSLSESTQALQAQQEQLINALQASVARQEETALKAFEQNMAQIVEHYLLGAVGDVYDVKAQLPAILKQLEANKQAIVDDMKL